VSVCLSSTVVCVCLSSAVCVVQPKCHMTATCHCLCLSLHSSALCVSLSLALCASCKQSAGLSKVPQKCHSRSNQSVSVWCHTLCTQTICTDAPHTTAPLALGAAPPPAPTLTPLPQHLKFKSLAAQEHSPLGGEVRVGAFVFKGLSPGVCVCVCVCV